MSRAKFCARNALFLGMSLALSACGGGGGSTSGGSFSNVSSSIKSGEQNVSLNRSLTFDLGENVSEDQVGEFDAQVVCSRASAWIDFLREGNSHQIIGANLSLGTDGSSINIALDQQYQPDSECQITLNDGEGKALANVAFATAKNNYLRKVSYQEGSVALYTDYLYDAQGLESSVLARDTSDTVFYHQKTVLGSNGLPEFVVTYNEAGDDSAWFSADDQISAYHQYFYDQNNQLIRHDYVVGAGDDEEYFTADDQYAYSQSYTWNSDNALETVTLTQAGNDNQLGTADDVVVERVVYSYNVNGMPANEVRYSSSGSDGTWATPDDIIATVAKTLVDSKGRLSHIDYYSGWGTDGVWDTPDDQKSASADYVYVGNQLQYINYGSARTYYSYGNDGYLTKKSKLVAAGNDGMWNTYDDVKAEEYFYPGAP